MRLPTLLDMDGGRIPISSASAADSRILVAPGASLGLFDEPADLRNTRATGDRASDRVHHVGGAFRRVAETAGWNGGHGVCPGA